MQKYSKLFAKTNKSAKEFASPNATLLIKAGFVDQVMAGVYSYLPLGIKVLAKIEKIVREEMNKISQEIFMPSLAPFENWQRTNRLDKVDVLFQVEGANESSRTKNPSQYILNSTHEEIVTPLVQSFVRSYKDLPLNVYQIQTKFRNEARPKSGLLRGREFRMKDAYSFHVSEADLLEHYEVVKSAYSTIFERLGLGDDTVVALASGGDFTKEFSHEFQTRVETGEDILFRVPSTGVVYNREVAPSQAPKLDFGDEQEQPLTEVLGKGIIGVEALAEFLKIPVDKTTKTILFETEKGEVIAAAVRGTYEIDTEKLKKVAGVESLQLASAETVKRVTNAEVGYAGVLNLPAEVRVFFDESTAGRKNFECGANRTDYHSINVNFGRDLPEPEKFYDIKVAREGDLFPETGEKYEVFNGCEVGNIFPLNTKFSTAFDYNYIDENGKEQLVYMGCYGLGTTRVMGVIAEKYHDEKGLVWPAQVAPFDVHFITIDKGGEFTAEAEELIAEIEKLGLEVLWDDREKASAGEKFADSELIGIPLRIVLSSRSKEKGGYEFAVRKTGDSSVMSREELLEKLNN
jgi:prolyl-tRNA synthetase